MEHSSFFNAKLSDDGTPDRVYTAENYANYFSSFIGNGVFPNPSTNLQVCSNEDMFIKVSPGKAWINGYMYYNDSDLILKIDPADGVLKRIDRIVLRLDFLNREITSIVKKGVFGSSPVATSLQRDANAYELCIAEILVNNGVISIKQSNITDTRLNSDICGIVTQTVKTIDTTTLFQKLEAYIDERGKDVEGWVDNATTQWGKEFNTWFDTIKNVLDGDVAGALANRITLIEKELGANKSTLESNINAIREVL